MNNLYLHFPFCRSKCAYCALHSRAGVSEGVRNDYVKQLSEKVRLLSSRIDTTWDTVYFGGGTPGLCNLEPLFEELRSVVSHKTEFTVELHPLDVNDSLLSLLHSGGVNRISMGIQSFDDSILSAMGRNVSAALVADSYVQVREIFPNSGFDLIAGYPGDSEKSWRNTLEKAILLSPAHVSVYSLIREPKTILDLAVSKGKVVLPSDDEALDMVSTAAKMLGEAGLHRYEISSYALCGRECQHNLAVWRGEDYVAAGEGAYGREGLRRYSYTASRKMEETLSPSQDRLERAVFRLRLTEGISRDMANEMGWIKIFERFAAQGLVLMTHDSISLTSRGMEVCDSILAELI